MQRGKPSPEKKYLKRMENWFYNELPFKWCQHRILLWNGKNIFHYLRRNWISSVLNALRHNLIGLPFISFVCIKRDEKWWVRATLVVSRNWIKLISMSTQLTEKKKERRNLFNTITSKTQVSFSRCHEQWLPWCLTVRVSVCWTKQ